MKTFLPIMHKNASQTKSWRTSPAIHMWRGYPHALGVYLYINCRVWASRKSATTGKFFSNDKMDEHIQTYNFGKNEHGKLVYNMEDEEEDNEAQAPEADEEEKKAELPAAVVDAANTAFAPAAAAVTAAPAAAAAGAGAQVASAVPVAAAAAAAGAAAARPGTYEDGIRIPWWFHDSRVHDSDAAVLYRKDPAHYKRFKSLSKKHDTYVWPRDIDANHPEQKDELDALAAIIAKEEAAKLKAKTQKKQKKSQPVSDESEDMGEEEAAAGPAAAAAAAVSSTPSKKRRTSSSSPVGVSELSPANTPRAAAVTTAAPAVRTKRSRAAAAASPASPLAAPAAAESSPSKRAKKSAAADGKPKAQKKIQL